MLLFFFFSFCRFVSHVSDLKGRWEKNGCAPHSENRPTGDPGERTKVSGTSGTLIEKSDQATELKVLCPVCPQADLCVTPAAIPGSRAQGLSGLRAQIPSLLSMPTRNHMDVTIPALPAVAPEVLRVAEHRHQKGLMYPYIYHTLTKVRGGTPVVTF